MTTETQRVARVVEGVVALCLGQRGSLVWMPQLDAAAFHDGERIYLPRPATGSEDEFTLLLAIALREIAKRKSCDTSLVASTEPEVVSCAAGMEEARLKRTLYTDYLGAPAIFDQAHCLAAKQMDHAKSCDEATAISLLAWAAAHDGLLGSRASAASRAAVLTAAEKLLGHERASEVAEIASRASRFASTAEVLEAAKELVAKQVEPPPQSQPSEGASDEHSEPEADPHGTSSGTGGGDEERDDEAEGPDADAASAGDQSSEASAPDPDSQAGCEDEAKPESGAASPEAAQQGAQSGAAKEGEGDKSSAGGESARGPNAQAQQDSASSSRADSVARPTGADPLSDALARLNGFTGAADRAEEVMALGLEPSQESDDELEAAVQAALSQVDAIEELHALATTDGDESNGVWGGSDLTPSTNAEACSHVLPAVQGRLVTSLMRELQNERRRPFLRCAGGRQIATRHAWKLRSLGDVRVFKRAAPAAGIEAAISVLLDISLSMQGEKLEKAVPVAHGLVTALARISGVRTSLDVFPHQGKPSYEMVRFKQNPRSAQRSLEELRADGGTPTGRAMRARLGALLDAKERYRAMLIVNDGLPDPGELALVRELHALAAAEGIDIIGVGICVDVSTVFPNSITVKSVDDLPDAIEGCFTNILARRMAA